MVGFGTDSMGGGRLSMGLEALRLIPRPRLSAYIHNSRSSPGQLPTGQIPHRFGSSRFA